MRLKEEIEVKKATVADAEILKIFWLNLAEEMFEIERYIEPIVENADVWTSHILESIEEARNEVLIARKDLEPVGFINWAYPANQRYQTSMRFVVIHDLYVKPSYRRMGIGTRLLEEALDTIRKRGLRNVRISVLSENVKAVRFYEKLGFEVYRYGMRKLTKVSK